MRRTPEPLDPVTLALLASERAFPSQPEETRQRAFTRARVALARGADRPPRSVLRRWLGGRPLAVAAVGIAAAAAWAAVREPSKEPAPLPSSVDSIQTPGTSPSTSGHELPPAVAPAPIEAPELALPHRANSAPRVAPPDAPTIGRAASARQTARADSYDAELRWLERARSAVARGDFKSALAAIARHEREFPAGKLAEERDALRIKALLGLGRVDKAKSAAAAFRHDFPRSALLPRVEEMLHAAP